MKLLYKLYAIQEEEGDEQIRDIQDTSSLNESLEANIFIPQRFSSEESTLENSGDEFYLEAHMKFQDSL